MNAEEAARCLSIGRKHYDSNNLPSAIRFVKKSIALHTSVEATTFLAKLEKESLATPTAASSANKPPLSHASPRASTSRVPKPQADEDRDFTPAQAALVKRVKLCKVTEYYEILALKKGCDDSDIKKAYRKLALGLHPDKCGAPGAEEAFKMVSKAFQVLSDSNKRAIYDQTGGDPDSRGNGGGSTSPFSYGGRGSGARGFGGGSFGEEELSPEDLFRFFFGQGGGGGFSGNSGATFQFFGPGGVRMQNGRRVPQGAGQNARDQPPASIWIQIAPLLILFAFSVLTQLPSLFGSTMMPDPDYRFEATPPKFTLSRETSGLGVPYFVNLQQFSSHPIYESFVKANPSLDFKSEHEQGTTAYRQDLQRHLVLQETKRTNSKYVIPKSLGKFELAIERTYVNHLHVLCQQEIQHRQNRLEQARGFFGIGADWEKVKEITNMKLAACDKLASYGYQVNHR